MDDYLLSRRAAGASRKTIANLELALRRVFLPWWEEHGISQVAQLQSRDLDQLSIELQDSRSMPTAWTYIRNIRLFLRRAQAEGESAKAETKLPKLGKPLVEILEGDEIQRLEDAADSERDKLIIRVLADGGLRVGELVKLRLPDLTQHERSDYLRVRGKGGRAPGAAGPHPGAAPAAVPGASAAPRRKDGPALRGPAPGGSLRRLRALTESGVQQLVRELGAKAGTAKRVHPHLFRHSAATWMLRRGMNPLLVAKILGHESLAMITRTYSHLTVDDAHEALMAALRGDE